MVVAGHPTPAGALGVVATINRRLMGAWGQEPGARPAAVGLRPALGLRRCPPAQAPAGGGV